MSQGLIIRHIQVVNLHDRDVIIYQVKEQLPINVKQQILSQLQELFPSNKILITEANIKIIRRD